MVRCAFLFIVLGTFAAADDSAWSFDENVAVLDPDNFDAFIASQEYTIVEFYAPWCGHCKSLAPEWASAAGKTRKLSPPTILAKVDADKHRELAERYDVSGFPTIKVFKGGKPEEYDGPREAKGIVSFVKKDLGITGAGSLTKLTTADEAAALKTKADATLVGVFREPVKASAMFNVFSEVASELPSYTSKPITAVYSASYSKDPVATALGVTPPAILLLKQDGSQVVMKIPRKRDELTEDAVVEWLQKSLA